jgi:hypothetical protein
MSGLEHWLPSYESFNGLFVLLLWAAGVVTTLFVVMGALAMRDDGIRGTLDVCLRAGAVLILIALGWGWFNFSALREQAAERRALNARATELAAVALAPGSALACLNATGNEAVESGCLEAVFATPQTVAAAVAYTDARLKLLADGLDYANRDKSYANELENLRRALEADRYGVVAHVFGSRGCKPDDCAGFKVLRDASNVRANLRDRYFEAHVASHSQAWRAESAATVATATTPAASPNSPTLGPMLGPNVGPTLGPATSAVAPAQSSPPTSKYNFPSADSIPPVSIMNAEPTGSTPPAGRGNPPPAPRAQTPPARRQSANRPAAAQQQALPPPPPAPPSTIANPGVPPNPQ